MKEYKEVQIIKHALQHYITRPGATDKDLHQERQILDWYTERAKMLKQKYSIISKNESESI